MPWLKHRIGDVVKKAGLKSDAILLSTAVIWGFAFVAQRAGMVYVGPFTFNGVRFALGAFSLLPLCYVQDRVKNGPGGRTPQAGKGGLITGGILAGVVLFFGASFQQIGIVYTTAGKAGFITGLYVVIVPILGLLLKQRPGPGTWIGAGIAAIGLYFLSITEEFTIEKGDSLVLAGAFFWATHVLIIGWLSPKTDSVKLAFLQFATCSALSLVAAMLTESIAVSGLFAASIPILYGGICSVGIAYTLQVVGQKGAPPAHAAIILSLETVFAAFGGWIILGETIPPRGLLGCALMLAAMVISQVGSKMLPLVAMTNVRVPPHNPT